MKKNRFFPHKRRSAEHIFYLECDESPDPSGKAVVYFVNNSEETLDRVSPASGGFTTADDEAILMTQSGHAPGFKNVEPGEAVAIDTYDPIFDGDFVISWGAYVSSPSIGARYFSADAIKGYAPNVTLHWQPLPEEMLDSEKGNEPVSPKTIAEDYCQETGLSLPKSTFINQGDMRQDYASERLSPSGLKLRRRFLRNGQVIQFEFIAADDRTVFHTTKPERAIDFVKALKNT